MSTQDLVTKNKIISHISQNNKAKEVASGAIERIKGLFLAADVVVNGSRPWDIQVQDKRFYAKLLSHASLG